MAESILGKINYLTEEQYQNAKANGTINENEIYLTPDASDAEISVGTVSETLWENPNPLASVDTMDIVLNSDKYDELVCYFYNWVLADIPLIDSVIVPKGYSFNLVSNIYVGGTCHYGMRSATRNSDTSFTFGKQFGIASVNPSNTMEDGSWLVPVKIVGRRRIEFPNKEVAYDTEEHIIGTWVDGKPLYRKVFNTISVSGNGSSSTAHGISNLDAIARYTAHSYYNGVFRQVPYSNNSVYTLCEIDKTNIYIYNTSPNPYTVTVIMEYTKTTD